MNDFDLAFTLESTTGAGDAVVASGGTIAPPPAPGSNNGLIVLSTNQSTNYLVGESAVLTLHESVQPGGGNRWFFRVFLDDQAISLTPVPNTTDNSYTTPIFDAPGSHIFRAESFVEDTALATRFANSIEFFQADVTAVNNALLHEQSPTEIARLQAQKSYDLEQIALAQAQQELNRTKAGESVVLAFDVVE